MYCGYTHRTDQGKILKKKTIIGLRETRAAHIFYQLPLAPRTSFAIIFMVTWMLYVYVLQVTLRDPLALHLSMGCHLPKELGITEKKETDCFWVKIVVFVPKSTTCRLAESSLTAAAAVYSSQREKQKCKSL